MKLVNRKLAGVLVGVSLLAGCATIIHGGSSQKISISSDPVGANVSIDGATFGVTPLVADLKRSNEHIVVLNMDGYQPAQLTLTKSVSGWVWGNVLIGGLIGLAVDFATGGVYNLTPEQLNSTLVKQGVTSVERNGSIYVVTTLKADPSWHKLAQLSRADMPAAR